MRSAIIIVGMLRFSNVNSRILQEAAEKYDVYIVTYKYYERMLSYLGNIKNVTYLEDLPYDVVTEKILQEHNGVKSPFLQFQKLLIAFEDIRQVEQAEGFRYDNVFKTRTEMLYGPDFSWEGIFDLFKDNLFYMYTDVMFGAKRDLMEEASDFFVHAMLKYWRAYDYRAVNVDNIEHCDFGAGRFDIIKYPKELVYEKIDDNQLKEVLVNNKDRIREINKMDRTEVPVYSQLKDWKIHPFSVEEAFLHYILDCGFIVKHFPPFAPKLPPVPIRRNMENILKSVETNDLEFLVKYAFSPDADADANQRVEAIMSVIDVYKPELTAPFAKLYNKLAPSLLKEQE